MLRGVAVILLLMLNLAVWGVPVLLSGIVKLALPGRRRRDLVRWVSRNLAERWVALNDRILDRMLATRWEISGIGALDYEGHYLIISNHVSWVDIVALFRAFHGRAAFIRFFLKRELIWFPIVGQACWALDFPFMRRHPPEVLEKHPEKRSEDLETTRAACRRFRKLPVAILNFVEGTRFSPEKRDAQGSPYPHLLRPRLGGIALALASLGDQLDATFDVTLAYPGGEVTMWQFVTNRVPRIVVEARRLDVPAEFMSERVTRPGQTRDRFREWFDTLWREKDEMLAKLDSGAE